MLWCRAFLMSAIGFVDRILFLYPICSHHDSPDRSGARATTTAEAQRDSTNAMFVAARCGEIPAMKWLLSDGGANITAVEGGKNIWQLLSLCE
jgi:hypothetical protein